MRNSYNEILQAGRGTQTDYRLDSAPLARGGQADVVVAVHKQTGLKVAVKRLISRNPDAVARMKREIDCGRELGDNPHVMEVLDFSLTYDWFVMPLAEGSAETFVDELQSPPELRSFVSAVCDALDAAHALGWVHRDLKPANVLRLDGRWMVADWGLGRRPRGQTTEANRTRIGTFLGTEGFAPPELGTDAHGVGPSSDIYSLGQLIGWIIRREWPQANMPLIPKQGPWHGVVRAATQLDPARRPQDVRSFRNLVVSELDERPAVPGDARQLLRQAGSGDRRAGSRLFDLAAAHTGDFDLYTGVLVQLPRQRTRQAAADDPARSIEIVRAMAHHLEFGSELPSKQVDWVITWLFVVSERAAELREWDLLEEAVDSLLLWDSRWDQRRPQNQIKQWLGELVGYPARVVADVLRRHPDSARHFREIADDRQVDVRIRGVVGVAR
ncbi:protein kinase domain-containing protein [Micromonospora sp. NPDC002411]